MDEASPFRDAAPYYDAYRAPYPAAALEHVTHAFGSGEGVRVLDLGCGPGTLAIPLSRVVADVVAVDPDAAMLAEGRRLAVGRGQSNIRWREARAEDLAPSWGHFRFAVMGQSFHWMNRDLVLEKLAQVVEDGGGLALFNPGKRRPQERWESVVGEIVTRYLGRRGRHPAASPEAEHEPSLRRSAAFADFTVREFPSEIVRDIPGIIGYVYSTSGASRPLFGDRSAAFEADLTVALLELEPSGTFHETLETEVLLAPRKPG